MSKPYSGMPAQGRVTWIVPRWLKEAFVAFAVVVVLAVGASKAVEHFGGAFDRARTALDGDEIPGNRARPPPLLLQRRGGGSLDLARYRGKTVLVNFWASWCAPCREEMPSLERLAASMDPSTFAIVAASVDDGWREVDAFLPARTSYDVGLDVNQLSARAFGTSKFPETYLIDADGRVRSKFVGARDWTDPRVFQLLRTLGARPGQPASEGSHPGSPAARKG